MPSEKILRTGRVRLDMLEVVYRQRLFLLPNIIAFVLFDASDLSGVDYLSTIEDNFAIPSASTISIVHTIEELKLQDNFHTGHELLSTVAKGRAGLVKKSTNIVNLHLMKSGTE